VSFSEPVLDVTTTDDHITIVTLNRPERRNALSNTVLDDPKRCDVR